MPDNVDIIQITPDYKTVNMALAEYTSAMRMLAENYAQETAELRMQHANELRLGQIHFEDAMRSNREKLLKKLGVETLA